MARRRAILRVYLILFVLAAALAAFSFVLWYSADRLRGRLIATLADRFDSEVELGDLHVRAFPALHVDGSNLILRHHGRRDVPPLISIRTFSVDAGLAALAHKHISHVTLTGLDIEIPPGHENGSSGPHGDSAAVDSNPTVGTMVVDDLESTGARLVIIPRERDAVPKAWDIHRLRMHQVGVDQSMPFEATLTNAVPPGEIETSGRFGPWNRVDPGATPLDGTFRFDRADLSVFKGISGILSAKGRFGGSLGRIDVHGETDIPEFTVTVAGHPVPLHTAYHTIVDGTNGNTYLERIDASFLKTKLVAHGSVIDTPGVSGRTVNLEVRVVSGRIQDLMLLAVRARNPPMVGAVTLTTTFVLPPGPRDVVEKLRLNGQFVITSAVFTNFDLQQRLNELSWRTRGHAESPPPERVASNFRGRFRLQNGVLTIPDLTFQMPGATVRLAGKYALRSEALDFRGAVTMDAKVSQLTTGPKRFALKLVDPIFRRKGRTLIPIKITGTRESPSVGLDKGRVFKRSD